MFFASGSGLVYLVCCVCFCLFGVCGLFLSVWFVCVFVPATNDSLEIFFSEKRAAASCWELFRHLVLIAKFASREVYCGHWLLSAKPKKHCLTKVAHCAKPKHCSFTGFHCSSLYLLVLECVCKYCSPEVYNLFVSEVSLKTNSWLTEGCLV